MVRLIKAETDGIVLEVMVAPW